MKKYLYIYVLLTITILLMAGCTTGGIPQLPVDNPEDSLDEITGVTKSCVH